MDAADPEGKMRGFGAISREERGQSKLPLLLLITHSLLICACAAFCSYIWHRLNDGSLSQPSSSDSGIYLNMLKTDNERNMLNFTVTWKNNLELEHGSKVKVPYPGPYIFYICAVVCCNGAKGNLNLMQGHTITSIELLGSSDKRCTRHQRLVSLYETEVVSFSFMRTDEFYLKDLRVGLQFMLGSQNISTPEELER